MTDLAAKFSYLEGQLDAQNSTLLAAMASISDTLASIDASLSTLNDNGATNTRYILNALAQQDKCADCPPPSTIVPPTDDTSQTINADRCKRAQALVYAIEQLCVKMDALSALSVAFTPTLLTDAFTEVYTEFFAGDTVPSPSFGETLSIVSNAVTYVVANVFVGDTLSAVISPVLTAMRDAIYGQTSADLSQSAFRLICSGLSDSAAGSLISALGYNELFSYFLDPSNDVDLTGFDGGICAIPTGECYTFISSEATSTQGFDVQAITGTVPGGSMIATLGTSSGPNTWTPAVFSTFDYYQWTARIITGSGVNVVWRNAPADDTGSFAVDAISGLYTFVHVQTTAFVSNDPFTLRLCPPGVDNPEGEG